jgi:hypothetical protein
MNKSEKLLNIKEEILMNTFDGTQLNEGNANFQIRNEAIKDLLKVRKEIRNLELKIESINKKFNSKIRNADNNDWIVTQQFGNLISKLKDLYPVIDSSTKKIAKK